MFGDLTTNEKGWKYTPLQTVCDVRDGTHDSPKYVTNSEYRLLTSKNFTKGYVDFSNINRISKEDFDKINKRSRVDTNDIIMPMIGTVGSPVIVGDDSNFAIKNVALIKFSSSKYLPVFVKQILDSEYFQNIVVSNARGSNRTFISLDDLRTLPVPVVEESLQKLFADYTVICDKLKFEAQERLKELNRTREELIDKHFR